MRLRLWDSIPQDEDGEQRSGGHNIRCKNCGARNLQWEDDNGKWKLVHPSGMIHRCPFSKKVPLDLEKMMEEEIE